MNRRLFLELAVVAAAAGWAWVAIAPRWNGFFSPLKPAASAAGELPAEAAEPGERLGRPAAALPPPGPAPGVSRPPAAGESMLVVPERPAGPALAPGAEAPRVFERAPIARDALALARTAPAAPARRRRGWLAAFERLVLGHE